jgi:DNA-binding HxlR family transcriptional regulator
MVALDLLGRRTALRLLWELRNGPLTFRALQEACETNARLLNTRLTELKSSGLVEHSVGGYRLTDDGLRLETAMKPLSAWAKRWAKNNPTGVNAVDPGTCSA